MMMVYPSHKEKLFLCLLLAYSLSMACVVMLHITRVKV